MVIRVIAMEQGIFACIRQCTACTAVKSAQYATQSCTDCLVFVASVMFRRTVKIVTK